VLHVVCDLTIAADNARFGQTGPRVGSFDGGFGAGLLANLVGPKKAKEIWFLCRQYSAEEALEMGLVNRVVPYEELETETIGWCREMLEHSPIALRCLKAALNADCDGQAGLQELAGNATLLFYLTEEGKEGSLAGISVNPVTNKIYVGSLYPEGGNPGLYVIDGNTLKSDYLEKWQYGIKDIQLDPESNFLYVGAKYDNLVSAIDESNNQIVENITVQSPIALTLNAEEKILYEAGSDGKVNAIDLSSKKNISSIQAEYVKNIMYNPNDKLLYIVDQNMTNILSKNSNGTKSMAIAVNTSNNIINKFETNFMVENILINTSTDQAYLLGYDGKNSKLFIVNSH